ncbi:MAG TPA: hypothetical protein VK421_03420 [Pyrinomonadaceae bacterium]|nr:hypothetical protein [Pyrinomonadaceae bacterium]
MKVEEEARRVAPGDTAVAAPRPNVKAAEGTKTAAPRTNPKRMPMVGWYDPRQLFKTGIEVAISTVFGRHSDFRIVEAISAGPPQIYDYTCHYNDDCDEKCDPDPGRPRDSIWIDYVGDVGDGWNPTYAVAYLLAQAEHKFKYRDRESGREYEAETKRGDVLVFGGDQVYPTANRVEYEQRLRVPYRVALPRTDPGDDARPAAEPPHAFAIPGNHDWYDSLVSFTRLFTTRRWFGGWRTRQSRSYFALKLPHGWWMLGTDFQLASDIDAQQVKYFEHVADEMKKEEARTGEQQRVILCHAEPHWIRAALYEELDPNYSESNLLFLESKLGTQVAVFLAGDLHHYRRYEATDEQGITQKITAGGGGAFLHPTHYGLLGKSLDVIEEKPFSRPGDDAAAEKPPCRRFEQKACFPPKGVSSKLCWRNLIFPYLRGNKSWSFGLVTAGLYLLTTLSVLVSVGDPNLARLDYRPGLILATALYSILNSNITLFWVLLILAGFILFTDTHSRLYRVLMGLTHGVAHVAAAFAVALVSVIFVTKISTAAWVKAVAVAPYAFTLDLRVVLAGALILLGGFVFGSLVMGLYLLVSLNLFGRHSNEAFSSISVEDWKNFLRLRIDGEGRLTIYPVGISRVPRRWKESGRKGGPEIVPDEDVPAPELIEPPVVLEPARTKTGVTCGDPHAAMKASGQYARDNGAGSPEGPGR